MKKIICNYDDNTDTVAQVYELNAEFYCSAFQTNEKCIHFDVKCESRFAAMQKLAQFVKDEYNE